FARYAAFSPDGKSLALLGRNLANDPVLCFWDVASRRIRSEHFIEFPAPFGAFSPDGKTFVFSRRSQTNPSRTERIIELWDARTEKVRATLPLQSDLVYDGAFSPDGKTLATACWDGTV